MITIDDALLELNNTLSTDVSISNVVINKQNIYQFCQIVSENFVCEIKMKHLHYKIGPTHITNFSSTEDQFHTEGRKAYWYIMKANHPKDLCRMVFLSYQQEVIGIRNGACAMTS